MTPIRIWRRTKAPETGWPRVSDMSKQLTARRAASRGATAGYYAGPAQQAARDPGKKPRVPRPAHHLLPQSTEEGARLFPDVEMGHGLPLWRGSQHGRCTSGSCRLGAVPKSAGWGQYLCCGRTRTLASSTARARSGPFNATWTHAECGLGPPKGRAESPKVLEQRSLRPFDREWEPPPTAGDHELSAENSHWLRQLGLRQTIGTIIAMRL
jgi:hypothetical protein